MEEKSIQRPKILILSTAYLPHIGGSELAIKNITDRINEFEFDLITARLINNSPKHEIIGNVSIFRVGGFFSLLKGLLPKNFLPLAIFLKANFLLQKNHYKLIHAFQASEAAGAGWLLKFFHPELPFVITIQEGKDLRKQGFLINYFRKLIIQKADVATAISRYLAEYLKSIKQNLPVEIIPNGVDLQKFKIQKPNLENTSQNFKTIITTSRLVPKNGVGDLIEAVAILKKQIPNIKLLVLGNGELKNKLDSQIKNLGLEGEVKMLGEIAPEKVPQYLAQADVFVRPSLSEGLGNAFLEAMAAGLPVIGTSVGGIPDFLKDGETGLFCKVGNPEDLADKIISILTDDELRNKIINNGKVLIAEQYNWDIIADKFRNLYDKLL